MAKGSAGSTDDSDGDSDDQSNGDGGERTVISPGVAPDIAPEAEPVATQAAAADAAPDAPAVDDAATRIAPQPGPEGRTIIATPTAGKPAEKPKAQLVEAGTLINNNYRILALVSAGGMGEVYRAENVFTGDPVAVKVILPGLANDAAVLDLFRREARVLVQMRHEAIVRYHNFVLDQGLDRYCLIMEFVEGRHLGKRLSEDGPLREPEVIALLRRIGAGLHRAHASGVTHRDLSPDNVILRDDRIDEAVLIDFGIARSTELGDGLAGRFAGKFKYIAPEQLGHAGGTIGPATDIYGLALLIAAVARGAPLDMGDSVVSASAARRAIPDLTGISHRLFPLLQHMLEPDPQMRPADMGVVLRMLDDPSLIPSRYRLPLWAGSDDGDAAGARGPDSDSPFGSFTQPQPLPTEPAPAPPRRKAGLWLGLGALVLVAAGGLGVWLMRPAPAPLPDPEPVAPAALAARDTTTREGFLASQTLPPCTMAERISSGPNTGMIALIGSKPHDAGALADAYDRAFGTRATVLSQRITDKQCPAVDFLQEVSGRPAPAADLRVNAREADGSVQIQGSVAMGADRNLWLFLVAPGGEVYDLTAQLSAPNANSRGFGFALSSGGGTERAGPFLLVALGSGAALASVAAAPSGVPAGDILPAVLAELRAMGDSPSVAAEVVALAPSAESPTGDSAGDWAGDSAQEPPSPESAPDATPGTPPDDAKP
ncbi:serine/threonine-protein kinase [Paracoccus sp. (in: a-proteobacteria)]|uniref:serine/threonine-protein kinase n=1 Tax=Paracoccus sp. TaxID=267 RepID=UPI0035AEFE84